MLPSQPPSLRPFPVCDDLKADPPVYCSQSRRQVGRAPPGRKSRRRRTRRTRTRRRCQSRGVRPSSSCPLPPALVTDLLLDSLQLSKLASASRQLAEAAAVRRLPQRRERASRGRRRRLQLQSSRRMRLRRRTKKRRTRRRGRPRSRASWLRARCVGRSNDC